MSAHVIDVRVTACDLTQPGYNGVRYCHVHSSWLEPWHADRDHCTQAIALSKATESETSE